MTASVWSPNAAVIPQVNVGGMVKDETQFMQDNQRTVDIISFAYAVGTGSLLVAKNGKLLSRNADFIELTPTRIVLTDTTVAGDKIQLFGLVGITAVAVTDNQLRSDLGGGNGGNLVATTATGVGAVAQSVGDKLKESPTPSGFGGSLQTVINAVIANGGGLVRVPAGVYNVANTIAINATKPLELHLDPGASINKTVEGDLFVVTLTAAGTFTLTGGGTLNAAWNGVSATAAAVRVVSNTTNQRALVVRDSIKILGNGTGAWKYGFHLTDVQDPELRGMLIDGDAFATQSMIGIYVTAVNNPSVSWTITDIDQYGGYCGLQVACARSPGVEGLKLINCDFVGVTYGVLYSNTAAGYSPPQFEFIGCHINSYNSCIKITKAIQISITGGLYYRDGTSVGAFFELDGVQDFAIGGGAKLSIINAAVDIPAFIFTANSQACAFLRFDNFHYWANGRASPVFKFIGNILNVTIGSTCTKDTNGKWLDHSGITAKQEINLSDGISINAADVPDTVMTDCALRPDNNVDVSAAFWGNVNITGATAATVVVGFWNRKLGKRYKVKCDTGGVQLQHNANVNLRNQVNLVFAAGDTVDLLSESTLCREFARRAQ